MEPHDIGKIIKGIEINVYQAKSYPNNPGSWHAHISQGDITQEEILAAGVHPTFDPTRSEWWTAVSSSDTEEEAREKACVVIGSIFGQRLAKTLGPQTIPATTTPAKRQIKLAC